MVAALADIAVPAEPATGSAAGPTLVVTGVRAAAGEALTAGFIAAAGKLIKRPGLSGAFFCRLFVEAISDIA
jgi:hypothetical protein